MEQQGQQQGLDERVYAFIVGYKQEHDGVAPSHREIVDGCGLPGVSSVVCVLNRLEDAGRIYRSDGASRSIAVVGGRWTLALSGGMNGKQSCRCA